MRETHSNRNIVNILYFIYLFNSLRIKILMVYLLNLLHLNRSKQRGEKGGVKHNKVTQIKLNSM